ncbi:MAG: hypothetical protein K0U72_12540 [Gammaproteobacteria bacterium]|nr:hypothetical protein [Gammaproteobacteria bacterium]
MTENIDELVAAHRAETHKAPAHLVQQWHASIDEAAALERGREAAPRAGWHPVSFLFGMAVTAALALGVGIGYQWDKPKVLDLPPGHTVATENNGVAEPPKAVPVALARGLHYHLRESQQMLVDVNEDTDVTTMVLDIVEQNRLYEAAAENGNAPRLARVLRAFEPILLRLAADDIAPADAAALREQLSFELKVMLTKLARESSDDSQTT